MRKDSAGRSAFPGAIPLLDCAKIAAPKPLLPRCGSDGEVSLRYWALGAPMPVEVTFRLDPSGSVTEAPLARSAPSRER